MLFLFLAGLPQVPNFAKIRARGPRGLLESLPRDSIPPRGVHFGAVAGNGGAHGDGRRCDFTAGRSECRGGSRDVGAHIGASAGGNAGGFGQHISGKRTVSETESSVFCCSGAHINAQKRSMWRSRRGKLCTAGGFCGGTARRGGVRGGFRGGWCAHGCAHGARGREQKPEIAGKNRGV